MMKRVLLSLACMVAVSALVAAQDPKLVTKGQALTVKNKCSMCHLLAGKGGKFGKPLDGVFDRLDAAAITKILNDPQKELPPQPASVPKMPKVAWEKGDVEAVLAYLQTLKAAK